MSSRVRVMDNIPRVTQIIKECGLYDFTDIPPEILQRAAKFGSAVHKATELNDKGTIDMSTVNAPLMPYFDAWQLFLKDTSATPVGIELKVKSLIWGYEGTLDRVLRIDSKLYVCDIKATAKISPIVAIQTMAYKIAYEEEFKDKVSGRICVQLLKTGKYVRQDYTDVNDKNIWLSLVTLYKFKQKHNLLKKEG